MKRAAIYMRVSSDRQRKKDTIASQREILPELAKERGYAVHDTYIDEGLSGETIQGRPEFQRLLADIENRRFEAVFTIDFDRLSRSSNELEQAYIRETFKKHGVLIETPNGTHDLKNYENALISGIMGLFSSMEKSKILARTRRGKETKWRLGKHASGHVPFGYRVNEEKKYVIERQQAEIVKKVFEIAAQGKGAEVVAQELNSLNISTPSEILGGWGHVRKYEGWSKSSVRKLLDHTCYVGFAYLNITQRKDDKRIKRPRAEWIKIEYPPIVTDEVFNEVQRLKKVHRTNSGTYNQKYLISRLVKCECGSKLTVEPQVDGSYFYSCYMQRRRKACDMKWQKGPDLENAIWSEVEKVISDPEYLETNLMVSLREWEQNNQTKVDKEVLVRKLQDKAIERDRVIRLHVKEKITEGEMDQQLDSIRREEEILKQNLALAEKAEKSRMTLDSSIRKIRQEVKKIKNRIPSLAHEEKRAILQTLLGGSIITVFKNGEIEIPSVYDFRLVEDTSEKLQRISNG